MNGYRWDLFWMLTRTEFRMRDQGTIAGFLWTLLHPLFIFIILYVLFTQWMGAHVDNYAAYLLIGIVQWNFFSTATNGGLTCLRRKAPLILHHGFPRIFIVLSSVASVLLSHLLEWGILLAALCWLGVVPKAAWLLLPLVILVETALVLGLVCALSVLAVYVRDLNQVWGIVLYGLFFMTPVFYTAEILSGAGARLVALNPMAVLIDATRGLLTGTGPGELVSIWPVAAGAAVLCAAGVALYPRWARGVAEKL